MYKFHVGGVGRALSGFASPTVQAPGPIQPISNRSELEGLGF